MIKKNIFCIIIFISLFSYINQAQNVIVDENTFGAITARQIGPATMSGRISAIDAVDVNPGIVYVGAASGGLWKSKNYGTTFKPVFDKYIQSVGAITIDQQHPDTVWVGTGEVWVRNSVSVGDGIYKTTNGGETWTKMGLEKSERIGRIIVHPKKSDIVYVAVLGNLWNSSIERGLYKTSNGGKNWEKILYIDENTGCSDVAFDPENPEIVYAGMWEFRRKPWLFNSGGKGSGLFKSTDGGKTWNKLTKDLPSGILGRVAISISPIKPFSIYVIIEAEKTALYRSDDKGNSWKMMNKTKAITERPFYFALLMADPLDTNRIYKPGFSLNMSNDGGKTFTNASVEGGNYHPDLHAIYIGKKNNKLIYLGTDGGVYISQDRANTWHYLRNLPVSQFYHVSTDMAVPFNVYGGLQDNGSWFGPSKTAGKITNADWKSVGFGDGFYVYADKIDANIIYWQFQGGNIAKYNKVTGEYKVIKPYKEDNTKELRFNWNAPLIFAPNRNTMYLGSQYLFKSTNRGETWIRISSDLTTDNSDKQKQEKSGGLTIDNSSAENHCTIYTINESPLDSMLIWVGTDDGNLQVTTDGGKTWTNVVKNIQGLPANTWCSYVEPSHFDKNTIYVTFDGHREGNMKPYVFKSNDLGKSWKIISDSTIKSFCHIIKEDFVDSNLLFLGTEFGLYISIDGGKVWSQFTGNGNIPMVPVMDMVIQPRESSLVLATHGRGVMIIDDITPIRNLTNDVLDAEVKFLKSKDFYIGTNSISQEWTGDDEFVGRSPSNAANIVYYMKKRHVFGDMRIEIYNSEGKLVDKLSAGKRKGINIVPWNILMKPPRVPSSPQLEGFALTAPFINPGEYTIKIIKGNQVFESKIILKLDPNSPHSESDRIIRQKVIMNAYNLLETLAFIDRQANEIRGKALALVPKVDKNFGKKLTLLADKMNEIHKKLVSTSEGDITGEQRLREKISFIYGGMTYYQGKPTDSQITRIDGYMKEVEQIKADLKILIEQDLVNINEEVSKLKLNPIKVISEEEFKKEER